MFPRLSGSLEAGYDRPDPTPLLQPIAGHADPGGGACRSAGGLHQGGVRLGPARSGGWRGGRRLLLQSWAAAWERAPRSRPRRRGSRACRGPGREGGGRQGGRCAALGGGVSGRAASRAVFAAMKRPCEETTSESDMDETIDVGSENNYSG